MTTLLQRCGNLNSKLANLALAKLHVEDVRLIEERSGEWGARKAKLTGIHAKVRLLVLEEADERSVASKRKALRLNAATVLTRLQGNKDIKELTRDAVWTRLLKAADGLAEALEDAGHKAWSAHCEQLGSLEHPDTLRLRTPPTPLNEEALRRYQTSYVAYAAIANRALPSSADDLTQLEAHIAACKAAYGQITFNLPLAVGAFFDALQRDTATLANVTPQVLAWLEEQGQLERFRVRGARQ